MAYIGNVVTSFNVATQNINNDAITTEKIADGAILNIDVNSAAAIAGTKISPDFGSQTIATTGVFSHALGAVGTPSITFTGDLNTGIWSPAADTIAFAEGGVETMRIDSSGRVGIGTSSPQHLLDVSGSSPRIRVVDPSTGFALNHYQNTSGDFFVGIDNSTGSTFGGSIAYQRALYSTGAYPMSIFTNGTRAVTIDSSQRVGIGTTSPNKAFVVSNGGANGIELAASPFSEIISYNRSTAAYTSLSYGATAHIFNGPSSEFARVDSSGRLLVGTSTARSNFNNATISAALQIEGTAYSQSALAIIANASDASGNVPSLKFARTGGAAIGSNTAVANGFNLGSIQFQGSDGTEFVLAANIQCEVDGTPGADDMPGRLVFSTTADGASSPTSRMRISAAGRIDTFDSSGVCIQATSALAAGTSNYIFIGRYAGTQLDSGVACYAIYTNGSFQQLSDANLKKNIETTRDGYLEDLNKLRVVKYNWKDQQEGAAKELGLIAQEVEEVFPGLVAEMDAESEYANKGIKTSVLPYMTIKALQEATERIKQLETEMAAVKAQLA